MNRKKMITIDARQLAILCAAHFIARFDSGDVRQEWYRSDYDMQLEGEALQLIVRVRFDACGRTALDFRCDLCAADDAGVVEITGDRAAARLAALDLINDYLRSYAFAGRVCEPAA